MANTTIEIKYSQVSGNAPSSLANGEISINTADGRFFYKTPAGVITPFAKYPGPSGLNGEIQFNDSGTLGSTANLSIIKANGSVTVGGTVKAAGAYNEAAFMSVGSNGRGGAGYHTFLEANNTGATSGLKSFRINNAGQLEIINSAYSATILSLTDSGVLTTPGLATTGYVQFADGTKQYTANAGAGGTVVTSVAGASGVISNTQLINAVTSTNQITFNSIVTSNNGLGTNFRVGDDAWIGDVNIADTVRITGLQNNANGWLRFGSTGTEALGRAGAGPLQWGANTIWHSGNDGASSGLDADLLDGLQGSSYANATYTQAGFDAANTAQTTAQAGFNSANTAQTTAAAGFAAANTAQTTASAGFNAANTAQTTAQSGFNAANTAQTTASAGFNAANTAQTTADGASSAASQAQGTAQAAFTQANAAFTQASAATTSAQNAYNLSNTSSQLAFSNVTVNGVTLSANNKQTNLQLTSGNGVTLLSNAVATSINVQLTSTGVTPGTYGSSNTIPVITVDEQGRISFANAVSSSSGSSGGTGYPNSSVNTIYGELSSKDLRTGPDNVTAETPFAEAVDAFGVLVSTVYDCMDPIGSYVTFDLNT